MRKFAIILMFFAMLWSCSDSSSDPKETASQEQSFKSINVKTQGKHYFTFSTNTGTTTEPAEYDIAFGVTPLTVESAPCEFFTMPNDPVIYSGPGLGIAKVTAASLDDVTTAPAATEFKSDNITGSAFIGKTWFDQSYAIRNDVYVIKNCSGNFGLLDIKRYEINFTTHQITNIVVEFKYNGDGSTSFASTQVDSFLTGNAYDETKYVSLANGLVAATESYDLKIVGSSIWLGNAVTVKKLENKTLADISSVSDADFVADTPPSFTTLGWYSYGQGHQVTAKDYVYVVNTADGKYPAFEVTNYYDDEGNSGSFTIKWKYLK